MCNYGEMGGLPGDQVQSLYRIRHQPIRKASLHVVLKPVVSMPWQGNLYKEVHHFQEQPLPISSGYMVLHMITGLQFADG